MKELIIYVHGKNGSPDESEHYRPLFPECEVIGLDYKTFTPWETGVEIRRMIECCDAGKRLVTLIANSIGAFFCMHAGIDAMIKRAFFVSPVVDMEQLIAGLMHLENITEKELKEKGTVLSASGEILSWQYLDYVRNHPVVWKVPTKILYGKNDALTSLETMEAFSKNHHAELTVMEDGEHWFHTEEQMRFLDEWIERGRGK